MKAITINIPNHEVSFFKKMIAKMGWTYSETDVMRPATTPDFACDLNTNYSTIHLFTCTGTFFSPWHSHKNRRT